MTEHSLINIKISISACVVKIAWKYILKLLDGDPFHEDHMEVNIILLI